MIRDSNKALSNVANGIFARVCRLKEYVCDHAYMFDLLYDVFWDCLCHVSHFSVQCYLLLAYVV